MNPYVQSQEQEEEAEVRVEVVEQLHVSSLSV